MLWTNDDAKRARRGLCALAAAAALGACATSEPPQALLTEDADRFAALIADGAIPDAPTLQRAYLDPGTLGVEIFTPHRIEDADHLAAQVAANIERYRHAAAVCLPAARRVQERASAVLNRTAALLGETAPAQAFVLFGANNSGGTADARGLAIGLEVICDGKATQEEAAAVLEEFIVHEMVHTYQERARMGAPPAQVDLLSVALTEGVADFVMELALERPAESSRARQEFGLAREAELWSAFLRDYRPGVWGDNSWFYGPGAEGRPADMGYWLGQRIAAAYYARADDPNAALRELIALGDPAELLAASGYGAGWSAGPQASEPN